MKREMRPRPAIYPCPVLVVGSRDATGKPNLMIASWGGLAFITPPALTVAIRPETHTHGNIASTGVFTVAIPRSSQALLADRLGTVSGAKVDKFAGLTLKWGSKSGAPYADEFPLVMECAVIQAATVGSHTLFVGRIIGLLVDEGLTDGKALPHLADLDPLAFSPGNYGYHAMRGKEVGRAFRMKAKPDRTGIWMALVVLGLLVALACAALVMPKAMGVIGNAAVHGGQLYPR